MHDKPQGSLPGSLNKNVKRPPIVGSDATIDYDDPRLLVFVAPLPRATMLTAAFAQTLCWHRK
jgi:hypothetical protein